MHFLSPRGNLYQLSPYRSEPRHSLDKPEAAPVKETVQVCQTSDHTSIFFANVSGAVQGRGATWLIWVPSFLLCLLSSLFILDISCHTSSIMRGISSSRGFQQWVKWSHVYVQYSCTFKRKFKGNSTLLFHDGVCRCYMRRLHPTLVWNIFRIDYLFLFRMPLPVWVSQI